MLEFKKIAYVYLIEGTSLVAQQQRIYLPMQETWLQSLSGGDPLEEEMATHPSILAWEIPWTEAPGGLQCVGPQSPT